MKKYVILTAGNKNDSDLFIAKMKELYGDEVMVIPEGSDLEFMVIPKKTDFEEYKRNTLAARATIYPGKCYEEVNAIIELLRPKGKQSMKKTIWKFAFEIWDQLIIKMPKGAEILTVQVQHRKPCVWALVDPEADEETRHFEIFGTGHPVDCGEGIERKYIGTYLINDDDLVFHLFERVG